MPEMITVTINNEEHSYQRGTPFECIASDFQRGFKNRIALVTVNGKLRELGHVLKEPCQLGFVTMDKPAGYNTYVRTAIMMFIKAVYEVYEELGYEVLRVKVEFAIGHGLYCTVKSGMEKIEPSTIKKINSRMREYSREDLPITKKSYPIDKAMEIFKKRKMTDKEKLFSYRRSSSVNLYNLDDFIDYFYGFMLPSTGYVKYFDVISYEGALMLILPGKDNPEKIDFFEPREKLFNALNQSTMWGDNMEVDNVGDLNDKICQGELKELIFVQEALQESRIGEIASEIVSRENVKFVMIAGPSSSGKTTFSHRLSTQLRARGMVPHPIALDDYFVNREDTPKDENGEYDFECLEALDVELFNRDMSALLRGECVELPTYNFMTGKREYKGKCFSMGEKDILVIEGIHGLNDKMSYALPDDSKFKIYISALTSLNVDHHNRISTADGRLIRRMVRDARTRGNSAARTLSMWESVRRGEEKNIFPFQEKVDATFNSVLIYELSVLKQYAEPLLFGIKKGEPEYIEARRLLKFLEYFLGISSEGVPANSIVREFIGGSMFDV